MVRFDAQKKVKGTKVHVVVTEQPLPIPAMIGPEDEHKGRKLNPYRINSYREGYCNKFHTKR